MPTPVLLAVSPSPSSSMFSMPLPLGLLTAAPCPATPPSSHYLPSPFPRLHHGVIISPLTVVGTHASPPLPTCWWPSISTNASIHGTAVPSPLKPPCYWSSLYVIAHPLPYALFVSCPPHFHRRPVLCFEHCKYCVLPVSLLLLCLLKTPLLSDPLKPNTMQLQRCRHIFPKIPPGKDHKCEP